jgi:hypothetical protein
LEHDPSQVIDIPNDGTTIMNLDVFSTSSGSRKFSPSVVRRRIPNCYQGLFGEQAEYRLTVRVTADNATSKTVQLALDWRGDWQDFRIGEYRR